MNEYLFWACGGITSYLLGAVPFGFLIAKAVGVDIRTVGSGNIGATNVYRSISKKLGLLTFLLDFLKGAVASTLIASLSWKFLAPEGAVAMPALFPLFCGVMSVVGHSWTCFLGFKGGKGVATSAGMLVGVAPWSFAIAFSIWLIILLTARYMSVASCAGAAALAISVWPLYKAGGIWLPVLLTVLALLVIWRHRSNISRLIAGTEPRFSFSRKTKE